MSEKVVKKIYDIGQEHVFTWWNELKERQKEMLLNQIKNIDFDLLEKAIEKYKRGYKKEKYILLEQANSTVLEGDNRLKAKEVGEQSIKEGKIGSLVFAGGQGTRLEYNLPKGIYPVGPISKKSLFEIFAQKIQFVSKTFGEGTKIPWYIMTSEITDFETKKFFNENNFFGLSEEDVFFFKQGMLPAIDFQYKLIMDSKYHIFESPNGHGGVFKALGETHILENMAKRGTEYVFVHNIDNILVKVCDPSFIGHHIINGSDFSFKSLAKRSIDETLGTIALIDGKLRVIEYMDLPAKIMGMKDEMGKPIFYNGSINIYVVSLEFLERLYKENRKLPIHFARNKIPSIDLKGNLNSPKEPNGIKFETKIFDALLYARNPSVVKTNRKEEFSPLKNKYGLDSPKSIIKDMSELFTEWIENVEIHLPKDMIGKIEISPLFAVDFDTFKEKISLIGHSKFKHIIEKQIKNNGYIFLS